ncbi:SPOR domain-containing protein [Tabrizicola oligotrophica]|uniref:SPOR domain-containing protein n=1 Tax=Tabrizicola oligotrophica TaxID=2710650 RepID=A0A6M0QNF8_9RHOB|nr:SPOR domain-containing protein [Tabrizicola oligotrophica]NEY88955.1 SPOR domain-containing protein [Tabrizicola oligotrophica]
MADLDYDHFDGGYPAAYGPRAGRFAHLGGAAVSLALLLGAGVWGYQLAMRDVSGIPVIRAVGGPMRLAPANPGGSETSHQGLSVNAVAAAGTALPLPETLTLAPKAMELADEDLAGLEPLEPVGGAEVVALTSTTELEAAALPEALPATQEDAVAAALAEALGLEAPAAASDGAVVANLEDVTQTLASATEIAPESIAPGTLLVQLGAFDDQEKARAEWARLTGTFAELMGGKALVIQPAQSGGKTFYRLRAHGFANDDDTRRFCTAMLAENATCIPVAQR